MSKKERKNLGWWDLGNTERYCTVKNNAVTTYKVIKFKVTKGGDTPYILTPPIWFGLALGKKKKDVL